MIRQCLCGKNATTKWPCKACGSLWPMQHCHNRKHMNHRLSAVVDPRTGATRIMWWPLGYDGAPLPTMIDGSPNRDLLPCTHFHPHNDIAHWDERPHRAPAEYPPLRGVIGA